MSRADNEGTKVPHYNACLQYSKEATVNKNGIICRFEYDMKYISGQLFRPKLRLVPVYIEDIDIDPSLKASNL